MHEYKITCKEISFRIKKPRENVSSIVWLNLSMRDLNKYLHHFVNENNSNLLEILIHRSDWAHKSAGLLLKRVENYYFQNLFYLISSILQSNTNLKIDNTLILQATFVYFPTGSGRSRININSIAETSIISIQNVKNKLFLPIALVVGEIKIRWEKDSSISREVWKNNITINSRRTLQRKIVN